MEGQYCVLMSRGRTLLVDHIDHLLSSREWLFLLLAITRSERLQCISWVPAFLAGTNHGNNWLITGQVAIILKVVYLVENGVFGFFIEVVTHSSSATSASRKFKYVNSISSLDRKW